MFRGRRRKSSCLYTIQDDRATQQSKQSGEERSCGERACRIGTARPTWRRTQCDGWLGSSRDGRGKLSGGVREDEREEGRRGGEEGDSGCVEMLEHG